ncbi:MAG: DUF4932 domain-containing protein [Oscillospiraceae bacterium]
MKSIHIGVDERLELLTVLFYLSDYKEKLPFLVNLEEDETRSLYRKALRFFDSGDAAELVRVFQQLMAEEDFGFDAPIDLFLHIAPDFSSYDLNGKVFQERLNKNPLAVRLLNLALDFYRNSRFREFFDSNREFYEKVLADTCSLSLDGVFSFMDALYDRSLEGRDFAIKFMSGTTNGNYGITLGNTCCCVSGLYEGRPYLYPSLVLHEFSHPIINPLTAAYLSEEEKSDQTLFADVREQMARNAYPENETILNEYMIRAIECAYLSDAEPDGLIKRLEAEVKRGFVDITFLFDRISAYRREKGRAFEAFYQELLAGFLAFQREKARKMED